jgi:hypothetical protein
LANARLGVRLHFNALRDGQFNLTPNFSGKIFYQVILSLQIQYIEREHSKQWDGRGGVFLGGAVRFKIKIEKMVNMKGLYEREIE